MSLCSYDFNPGYRFPSPSYFHLLPPVWSGSSSPGASPGQLPWAQLPFHPWEIKQVVLQSWSSKVYKVPKIRCISTHLRINSFQNALQTWFKLQNETKLQLTLVKRVFISVSHHCSLALCRPHRPQHPRTSCPLTNSRSSPNSSLQARWVSILISALHKVPSPPPMI